VVQEKRRFQSIRGLLEFSRPELPDRQRPGSILHEGEVYLRDDDITGAHIGFRFVT
jgi:hypothetical protein